MADQTVAAAEGAIEAPTKGSRPKISLKLDRKKLLILGPVLLLLIFGGIGGHLYMNGTVDKLLGRKPAPAADAPKPLVFFDLPDFLVNLNSGPRKSNFLKLTVSLQIEKPEDQLQLQAVLPRIIDNCQIFLRELGIDDLRGAGGIYRLREELLARINAVSPVKVEDVLFKEMLVQ